jgi:hypothetical protein
LPLLLFAVTLFVSAFLLFLVQPMIGKMILPRLGGTPAVWNTCMVFFQAVLLAGYAYTHTVSTRLQVRRQLLLQCVLLALPLLFLPFAIGQWTPPTESNPVLALLWLLLLVVGIPFFVVATSAPLLQRWFAHTGHPAARDPYFLYAASNLGSMLALLAYPFAVEPNFSVAAQTWLWAGAYAFFIALTLVCGVVVWRAPPTVALPGRAPSPDPAPPPPPAEDAEAIRPARKSWRPRKPVQAPVAPTLKPRAPIAEITPLRRLRWIGLAAVPSSLMLGVTSYVTTDIAAIPLFWVVPLALYLLSFIFVFARWPVEWTGTPHKVVVLVQPLALILLAIVTLSDMAVPQKFAFGLHLTVFFLTALLCHGELARDRPSTTYLTEFYLWMSVGGVLGGLLNALVAPLVFDRIVEYMLVLALSCLLRPPTHYLAWFRGRAATSEQSGSEQTPSERFQELLLDIGYPLCLGLLTFALLKIAAAKNFWGHSGSLAASMAKQFQQWGVFAPRGNDQRSVDAAWRSALTLGWWVSTCLVSGIPLVICLVFSGRPLRFGLCALAFFLANAVYALSVDESLYHHRSFFGPHHVRAEKNDAGVIEYFTLIHGGIDHGRQLADPERRDQPITYFHPTGPIGQIFTAFSEGKEHPPYAVIGLGIGTLASYSKPGQEVDFYEIDPAVRDLSDPPTGEPYFHYLRDARKRGSKLDVKLGDGRLKIDEAPAGKYHIIVVDAFSSDAIPVHLLTLNALDVYRSKLADGGIVIFNITNRYLDPPGIQGMFADLAQARDMYCLYSGVYFRDSVPDRFASDWMILVKKRTDHRAIAAEAMHVFGSAPGLGGPSAVPWATLARSPGVAVPARFLDPKGRPARRASLWPVPYPGADLPEVVLDLHEHLGLLELPPRPGMEVPPLLLTLDHSEETWLRRRGYQVRLEHNEDMWPPVDPARKRVWTDDYSNLLSVLSW